MEKLIDDEYKITIIGNLIRDERKAQKKSASVIASLSGISQQFLSELERGKKSLPYSTVHSVFNVLNIHFDQYHFEKLLLLFPHNVHLIMLPDHILEYYYFQKTFFDFLR